MAAIVEQRSQPLGSYEPYDPMRLPGPHFTNPWGASSSGQPLYSQHMQHQSASDPYSSRPQYPAHVSNPSLDSISPPRPFGTDFTSSGPANAPAFTTTSTVADRYSAEHYASSYNTYDSRYQQTQPQQQQFQQQTARTFRPTLVGRDSFSDALDAGQGMVAMSQQDFTPRQTYPPRNNSGDSYGFPATGQSDHGSVSSGSSYPYYGSYSGSADGSVAGSSNTDYSSASEDIGQRTLPPPGQMANGYPPDATQMMTQFNSKLAASAQKKHKCKICDKRFTRPSSLQTHMYSHTGEKPFACDFDGCGRHFSVVSNLRRHKKCHKGDGSQEASSPED